MIGHRIGKFCSILFIFLTMIGNSYTMKSTRQPFPIQFNKEVLQDVVTQWFPDLNKDTPEYQTCWKAIFSILAEDLRNNNELQQHHYLHHMFNIKGRKITDRLFPEDPHSVRISGCPKTVFNIVIDTAKNALIRRLQGYYSDYVPFSFPPCSSMEIPLAPEEEFEILSNEALNFWSRIEVDPGKWTPCNVRVKSIGIELSDNGIISVFFATEFPTQKPKAICLEAQNGPKAGSTRNFPFKIDAQKVLFAKIPETLITLKILPPYPSYPFTPVPLISECTFNEKIPSFTELISKIITSPLDPDFCFRVMHLRSLGKLTSQEEERKAIAFSKDYLQKHLTAYSPFALFISSLIAQRYEKPRSITLSHVFLNSPLIRNNNIFQDLSKKTTTNILPFEQWHLDFASDILREKITHSETDADIFSIAMLLAKSALLEANFKN